jgi:hypothetical protein
MLARRGFSLIIVLLISLVGLAVIGSVMNIATVNTGAGMTASTINRNYNLLTSEVENARAWIIASLDKGEVPERKGATGVQTQITSADQLLVQGGESRRQLSAKEMGLYGVGGTKGTVTVKVYDMQYFPDDVSDTLKSDPDEVKLLPPSSPLFVEKVEKSDETQNEPQAAGETGKGLAANAGAYLIRASLEIDGAPSSTVELALIGAASANVK